MSYRPEPASDSVRWSYRLQGGPDTASFVVPATSAGNYVPGQTGVALGAVWTGEVVSTHAVDGHTVEVVAAGYARRLEGVRFRQKYNCLDTDGLPEYGSIAIADIGQIVAQLRPLIQGQGLVDIDQPTTGIAPVQAEVDGSVRQILDTIATAAGMAWYVDPGLTIRWAAITPEVTVSPDEVTTENVVNTLVMAGKPKAPYNRDGGDDAGEFAHRTAVHDLTGGSYPGGQARFESDKEVWIAHDAASVGTYGTREQRVTIPYLGDDTTAQTIATAFFALYAGPQSQAEIQRHIASPGPGNTEPYPHALGAQSVQVELLANDDLVVTGTVSRGALLASSMFKTEFIRAYRTDPLAADTTPPALSLSTEPVTPGQLRASEIGTANDFYATVTDRGAGVDRTDPTAVQLYIAGVAVDGSALEQTRAMTWLDPADPVANPQAVPDLWAAKAVDLTGFKRGTNVRIYARAVDRAGNASQTPPQDYQLEITKPVISPEFEDHPSANPADPKSPGSLHTMELTGGLGYLKVRVQDPSRLASVVCSHREKATAPFYGAAPMDDLGDGVWGCPVRVVGRTNISVTATDHWGDQTTLVMATEDSNDKTPPSATLSLEMPDQTQQKLPQVGSPANWHISAQDDESGVNSVVLRVTGTAPDDSPQDFSLPLPLLSGTAKDGVYALADPGLDVRALFKKGGKIKVWAVVTDGYGNETRTATNEYTIDSEEPTVQASIKDTGSVNDPSLDLSRTQITGPVRLLVRTTDRSKVQKVEVYWDDQTTPLVDITPNWDDTEKAYFLDAHANAWLGKHTLRAEATDVFGQTGKTELQIEGRYTGTGPDRTTSDLVDGWRKSGSDEIDGQQVADGSMPLSKLASLPDTGRVKLDVGGKTYELVMEANTTDPLMATAANLAMYADGNLLFLLEGDTEALYLGDGVEVAVYPKATGDQILLDTPGWSIAANGNAQGVHSQAYFTDD